MSIQVKAAPAQQGAHMNALELFRSGRDYIEIAAHLGTSVPSVETEIHKLRSAEKGDTAHAEPALARRSPGFPTAPSSPAPLSISPAADGGRGFEEVISIAKGTSHG